MSVGRSVGRSVRRSVTPYFFFVDFAVSRLAETYYCPCPTACDWYSRVYGLVQWETKGALHLSLLFSDNFLFFSREPRLCIRMCPSVTVCLSVRRSVCWFVMLLIGGQRRAGMLHISSGRTCYFLPFYQWKTRPKMRLRCWRTGGEYIISCNNYLGQGKRQKQQNITWWQRSQIMAIYLTDVCMKKKN